eukprot:jgi/Chrpa1/9471/Chrysochromulina_OHIO_Genome00018056-RA
MTKTPMVQRLWTQAQLPRPSKATLTEPFLSPADGKLHTTGKLERSTMGRRWLVLALTSFFMGCNYYCYDNPAALYRPLQNAYRNEPKFEVYYDLLYSVYSIPNIVLPLFGGLLVDKAGLYISLNLFSALILVGQAVFATGCSLGSLPLMLVGRFLFGLGGESISVAQSALIERWFVAGELGFALGGVLSISRLGSVINNALSPYIASATYSRRRRPLMLTMARDVRTLPRPFWLLAIMCCIVYGTVLPFNNVASALLLDRDYFPQGSVWKYPGGQKTFVYDGSNDHQMAIMCSNREGHARDSAFCQALVEAQTTAGLVMSEPYVLSALLTPLFGSMVDRYGQRATLVVLSAALLATSHALLALTSLPAPLLLVGIGLGYAVFASVIWPSIPSVVGRQQLGIAYGLVLELTTADAPSVDPNPYAGVSIFFACLGIGTEAGSRVFEGEVHVGGVLMGAPAEQGRVTWSAVKLEPDAPVFPPSR